MAKHFIKLLLVFILIVPFTAIGAPSLVRTYFDSQGFNFPLHLKIPLESIPKLVGPDLGERPAPEYTQLFHEGVDFLNTEVSVESLQLKAIPEATAFVLSDPFLMQSGDSDETICLAVDIRAFIEIFNKNNEIYVPHKIHKVGHAEILELSNTILFEKKENGWEFNGFVY